MPEVAPVTITVLFLMSSPRSILSLEKGLETGVLLHSPVV